MSNHPLEGIKLFSLFPRDNRESIGGPETAHGVSGAKDPKDCGKEVRDVGIFGGTGVIVY